MSDVEHEPTEKTGVNGTTRADSSAPARSDAAGVGRRVSAILAAAEEAAQQIRVDARSAADGMLRKAEEDAEARIVELTHTATEARREADEYARDMRMAVEAYAKKHRHEAEDEARQTTSEAESRAKSILESARERAEKIEQSARRHQEELRAETHRLEDRRRQALRGVRELMAVLEELLQDANQEPARARDESLDETLTDRRVLGRHSES
jgi:cell division septum initiation protein DivIVA